MNKGQAMEGEISIPGFEKMNVASFSTHFPCDYDPCWSQIHQQKLYEDLLERYQVAFTQVRVMEKQIDDLHQQNVNLMTENRDMKKHLNMLLGTSLCHDLEFGPRLDGYRKLSLGYEGGMSENECAARSPKRVVDSTQIGPVVTDRFQPPKSISVRSSGHLKSSGSSVSSASTVASLRASSKPKFDAEKERVHVKGNEEEERPLEVEVYKQGMLKTELCNKWQKTGTCPYGNHCQFAHGMGELRPILRHPRYKTEICRMVLNGAPCLYGHRCHFQHSLTSQEKDLARPMYAKSLYPLNNYH